MFHLTQKAGFCLRDVAVFGRYRSKQQEILKTIKAEFGKSIFEYNVYIMKARLEQLPWIKKVKINRLLYGKICIYITEKEPIAIYHDINENKFYLVDQDGEKINQPIASCFRGFPVFSGKNANKCAPLILQKINCYKNIRSELTAIAFIQERRWSIKLNNAVEIKLPEQNIDEALQILSILINDGKISSGDIVGIDFRIKGKVIFALSKSGKEYFKYIRDSRPM
jgi:cell division protein FtsQ